MGSDKGKNEGLGGLAAGAHICGCGDALAGRILHLYIKKIHPDEYRKLYISMEIRNVRFH